MCFYGLTEEQFWVMNPRKLKPYEKAFEMKEDRRNYDSWILGMYIRDAATCAVDSVMNGKNSVAEYPEEPYRLRPYTEEELEEKKEIERQKAISLFNSMEAKGKADKD